MDTKNKIILLPSNVKTNLFIDEDKKLIYHPHHKSTIFTWKDVEYQHIYILSHEDIKTDEWCFEVHNGPSLASAPKFTDKHGNVWWLRQLNMDYSNNSTDFHKLKDGSCLKVIQSTDESLNLPDVNSSSIQQYVDEYNTLNNKKRKFLFY